jgi:hypothetical protein
MGLYFMNLEPHIEARIEATKRQLKDVSRDELEHSFSMFCDSWRASQREKQESQAVKDLKAILRGSKPL